MFDLDLLFQKSELIPVIIQDDGTKDILMLGFTNREAVELTLKTGTEPQPAGAVEQGGHFGKLPPCEADLDRL